VAVYAQTDASDGAELLQATLSGGSQALRRRVNQIMRYHRKKSRVDEERIPFFCECVRTSCSEPVWLTSRAYDGRRGDSGQPLLLHGHDAVEK